MQTHFSLSSYLVTSCVSLREYKGKKFLSTSQGVIAIEQIDNIAAIEEDEIIEAQSDNNDVQHIKNMKTVGVLKLQPYNTYFNCGGEVTVSEDNEEMGECTRCSMVLCISEYKNNLMATVKVRGQDGKLYILHAIDKVLSDTAEKPTQNIIHKDLIKAHPFGMHFFNDILHSIRRL